MITSFDNYKKYENLFIMHKIIDAMVDKVSITVPHIWHLFITLRGVNTKNRGSSPIFAIFKFGFK